MKDIRQSQVFAKYMQNLDWRVEKIDSHFIYLRKFPLLGYFAKIPHPRIPINIPKILAFKKSRKIFRLKISPFIESGDKDYSEYKKQFLDYGFRIETSPFNPTTNYLIDLTPAENQLFNNLSEAKRRGVRRAIKNGIIVRESNDLFSFIKIRQHQYLPVWFLVGSEMQKLWENFYPKSATLLLAYSEKQSPVAGILLLFYNKTAYYWFASAFQNGKKLFAPTLLVWEALKISKKRGCRIFDFEGIYDERFPKASASWKGFTKFKEGFGVEKAVYMENFKI